MAEPRRKRAAPPDDLSAKLQQLERKLLVTDARLKRLEQAALAPQPVQPWAPQPAPQAPGPAMAWTKLPDQKPGAGFETTLGAQWLPKAGMLVFVLGVVFFLRYAFEQDWINRPTRIAMGVGAGIVLFALGEFLLIRDRRRFGVYSQILAGGGAILAYFSVYAAHAFPDYRDATGFTLEISTVLMAAIAALTALYAILRKTPVIAMEAVGLGVLASAYGEPWQPFSVLYVVFLAAAMGAAATWRRWDLVLLVTVFGSFTQVIALTILLDSPWLAMAAAGGLLLAFTAAVARPGPDQFAGFPFRAIAAGLVFIGTLTTWLVGLEELEYDPRVWHAPAILGLGVVQILLALFLRAPSPTRWSWGITGTAFVLLWPPFQFDDVATSIAWAGLAAVLAVLLEFRKLPLLVYALVANSTLLLVHLVAVVLREMHEAGTGLGVEMTPFAMGTVVFAWGWWRMGLKTPEDRATAWYFLGVAAVMPVLYTGAALDGFAISVTWVVWSTLLLILGFIVARQDLRVAALSLYGLVLARIFLIDLTQFEVIVRIVSFLVVGALLLAAGYLYARRARPGPVSASRPEPARVAPRRP